MGIGVGSLIMKYLDQLNQAKLWLGFGNLVAFLFNCDLWLELKRTDNDNVTVTLEASKAICLFDDRF